MLRMAELFALAVSVAACDMHFPVRHRPVLNAGWHNKILAGVKGDGPIAQLDVERTLKHKEKIVRGVMLMPVKWPLGLGHHNVVVVVSRNRAWGETVGERRELFGEICGCFHCVSRAEGVPSCQRVG